MGNRRVSPPTDPLVPISIKIKHSQKANIEKIYPNTCDFIRNLIDDALENHNAELAKLKEELTNHEIQTNLIKARINEIEKETNKQKETSVQIEQFLEKETHDLIKLLEDKGGNFTHIREVIKKLEPGIILKFNGQSGSIIKELERRVKDGYTSKGEKLYGL